MLGHMRVKPVVWSYPLAHLRFCISGIVKITSARVDVGQGYHCIRWFPPTQKPLNFTPELIALADPAT